MEIISAFDKMSARQRQRAVVRNGRSLFLAGSSTIEETQPVTNLHATILTSLGLNPDDPFSEHYGRQERLAGVAQSWSTTPGVFG